MADTLSKEKRSALMSRIHSSDTVPEKKVRSALWKRGFRYRLNSKALPGSPDIVLPKYRTVVFVNGCFWHGHENCSLSSIPKTNTEWWSNKLRNNRRRDALVSAHLEGLGWSVETVWECETVPAKIEERMDNLEKKIRANRFTYLARKAQAKARRIEDQDRERERKAREEALLKELKEVFPERKA